MSKERKQKESDKSILFHVKGLNELRESYPNQTSSDSSGKVTEKIQETTCDDEMEPKPSNDTQHNLLNLPSASSMKTSTAMRYTDNNTEGDDYLLTGF